VLLLRRRLFFCDSDGADRVDGAAACASEFDQVAIQAV
jgi:hypothetical protein